MRLIRPVFALACLALGVLVGILNRDPVVIDFGPLAWNTTLGVALLVALLTGALLGGLAVAIGGTGRLRQDDTAPSSARNGPEI